MQINSLDTEIETLEKQLKIAKLQEELDVTMGKVKPDAPKTDDQLKKDLNTYVAGLQAITFLAIFIDFFGLLTFLSIFQSTKINNKIPLPMLRNHISYNIWMFVLGFLFVGKVLSFILGLSQGGVAGINYALFSLLAFI